MGGLINLIKKLFSGVFSFIGGLFGGKKNGGYYMEAEDVKAAPLPDKSDAKAGAAKVGNDAKATLASAEPLKAAKETLADSAKSALAAVAGSATAAKDSVKTGRNEAAPVKPEPAKANSESANGSQPAAPANVALNMPKPTVTFATDYLTPKPTNSRRRPGANMSSFLEMAKRVKPST